MVRCSLGYFCNPGCAILCQAWTVMPGYLVTACKTRVQWYLTWFHHHHPLDYDLTRRLHQEFENKLDNEYPVPTGSTTVTKTMAYCITCIYKCKWQLSTQCGEHVQQYKQNINSYSNMDPIWWPVTVGFNIISTERVKLRIHILD